MIPNPSQMTFLGYQYVEVRRDGAICDCAVAEEHSLGLLRHRSTRGAQDLADELQVFTREELLAKQLSFAKSRVPPVCRIAR